MTKTQIFYDAGVQIAQADMKIKQAGLATGVTVTLPRTPFGGMLELHYPRNGKGWALTNILKDAAAGLPGVKVDKINGRVFVFVTGL